MSHLPTHTTLIVCLLCMLSQTHSVDTECIKSLWDDAGCCSKAFCHLSDCGTGTAAFDAACVELKWANGDCCSEVSCDLDGCDKRNITSGWSYITAKCPVDVGDYFAAVKSNIEIVRNDQGLAYLPEWAFNGIGDFVHGMAYAIEATQQFELPECTSPFTSETAVDLAEGWSLFGYPHYAHEGSVPQVLQDMGIHDKVVIVKDIDGNPYLPHHDYNAIGNFIPGNGYWIKMTSSATVTSWPPITVGAAGITNAAVSDRGTSDRDITVVFESSENFPPSDTVKVKAVIIRPGMSPKTVGESTAIDLSLQSTFHVAVRGTPYIGVDGGAEDNEYVSFEAYDANDVLTLTSDHSLMFKWDGVRVFRYTSNGIVDYPYPSVSCLCAY